MFCYNLFMTIKITKQLADLIEDSIENTYQRVEGGREHLEKAATYQVNKLNMACYIVCCNFTCVKHKNVNFCCVGLVWKIVASLICFVYQHHKVIFIAKLLTKIKIEVQCQVFPRVFK